MRWTNRLSMPQKIVLVIALGLGFGVIGDSVPTMVIPAGGALYPASGSALQAVLSARVALSGWLGLIIWLVLIILWALLSIRILRPSSERPPSD